MQHQTTINELAAINDLFSLVDHITVPETDPNTHTTEEVTLPPPLIRRTTRRDGTTVWVLTAPGIHERIFVADQAPVTVYVKDTAPAPAAAQLPPQQPQPAAWQQTTPAPAAPAAPAPPPQTPAPQPAAAPRRPAAPWTSPPQG